MTAIEALPVAPQSSAIDVRAATAALTRPPRLPWMDPCRGLAIGLVVAYHTIGYLQALGGIPMPAADSGNIHGEAGVDAFLLLSGFGLAYSARPGAWYQFLARRVWRLLPAYWLVLLGAWAFQVYRQAYAADPAVLWKDLAYHASCLHLIRGNPYTFSISSAMWFMGLIVPLYLAFAVVRPWVVRGKDGGYVALAWATAVAAVGGSLLMQYTTADGWGDGPRGHAPHRLPLLFLGALVGLAWQRRETVESLARRPGVLWGLAVAAAVPIYRGYAQFPFYLLSGVGIVLLGMGASALSERWRLARPIVAWLGGLGLISYELYLCHQYVMVTLDEALLMPWLKRRWPTLDGPTVGLLSVGLSLAAACWAAWVVRWAVAWRESRATWRATLPAVLVTSAVLAGGALAAVRSAPPDKARAIRLTVALPPDVPTPPAGSEPIVEFGTTGAGDLVFLQHDGAGRARVGVDHWSAPSVLSDWVDVRALTAGPWEVGIGRRGITVRAGPVQMRSPYRPFNWRARAAVGRNDAGFSSAPATATSRVQKVP